MKQGDIVILPFPFTDLTDSKLRPALIISNSLFNRKKNLILIAISTQKGEEDFTISLKQNDLKNGKLNKTSFMRLQNTFTLEKRLITKKVATLKKDRLEKINQKLTSFFTLD